MPSGEFKPRAGAGREHAGRSAKTAQPFQPDRAVLRQAARELRDLPPVRIGRAEAFFASAGAVAGAEQLRADRIGPQNPFAVGRPQPCGVGARRMHRQPGIAEPLQLEFRTNHRNDMTDGLGLAREWLQSIGRQTMTACKILSIASGRRQVHGRRRPRAPKPR